MFVAQKEKGAVAFNIADPANPLQVVNCQANGNPLWWPRGVFGAGGYMYIADGNESGTQPWTGSFYIVDATQSGCVVVGVDRWSTYFPQVVTVAGKYAYLGANDGLHIYDVTNPAAPVRIAHLVRDDSKPNSQNIGQVAGIAIDGHYAFIAAKNLGLKVVDIANPYAPTLVASLANYVTPSFAITIRTSPGHAFVADQFGGLVDL